MNEPAAGEGSECPMCGQVACDHPGVVWTQTVVDPDRLTRAVFLALSTTCRDRGEAVEIFQSLIQTAEDQRRYRVADALGRQLAAIWPAYFEACEFVELMTDLMQMPEIGYGSC